MEGESEKTSLKGLLQSMTPVGTELLQGTVISENPIKIQIANDSKLQIGLGIAVIPQHLTNYTVFVDMGQGHISGSTMEEEGHIHGINDISMRSANMTIYNALKNGDKVHVLSVQNGKKYYVLDRV